MTSLDDLRERFPHLGFALYALEPGGPVTLEVHDDGTITTVAAETAAEAIARAFPAPPAEHHADALCLLFDGPPSLEPPPAPPPRPTSDIRPAPTPDPLDIPGFLKRPLPAPKAPAPPVDDTSIFD